MLKSARLTSDLLARKGDATPAQKGYGAMMTLTQPASIEPLKQTGAPVAQLRPVAMAEEVDRKFGAKRATRHALTLRLDEERHKSLRILAARLGSSAQALMTEALDAYVAERSRGCACMREAGEHCAEC